MNKKNKFCIITTQRSGSTWLSTLLNSHPKIKSFEEPFIWRKNRPNWQEKQTPTYFNYKNASKSYSPWTLYKYLDLLNNFNCEEKEIDTIGFKIMYDQIKANPELLIKLVLDKYKIIHLVRQNHLDILISLTSAEQYGVFHTKNTNTKSQLVTLDTSSLIQNLDKLHSKYKIASILFKLMPLSVLDVSYESLLLNKNQVLYSILDFLQLDNTFEHFQSNLKRVNKGAYEEKIANYHQVAETLRNSNYAKFL